MTTLVRRYSITVAVATLTVTVHADPVPVSSSVSITRYATGLNDPRGLAFGPDRILYIAEAGSGDSTMSTVGTCAQVEAPVGPFLAGFSGRIMRVTSSGGSAVVADGLPSSEASPAIGGDKQGVSSVAFVGDRLFGLVSGGGCSHGHALARNGIVEIDGSQRRWLTDLSAWILANPGAKGAETPRAPDYEPDGVWYSLLFARDRLYALEPNHSLLVAVEPETGRVGLVNDLFTTIGDHTFTAMAAGHDGLYLGTLGRFAWVAGANPPVPDLERSFEAGVYKLTDSGETSQVGAGLKAVVGLAFDRQQQLYALQSPIFAPGTGSLVRRTANGEWEPVVTGLDFPTAVTLGPDDALYVSECGYHCAPGQGRVLRVVVP